MSRDPLYLAKICSRENPSHTKWRALHLPLIIKMAASGFYVFKSQGPLSTAPSSTAQLPSIPTKLCDHISDAM